jgi:ankyrin repeat protein
MTRRLTPRSTLALLKDEAKRWLRALRAGDADAIGRLRAVLPDAPATPVLRDVQHALAREHGLRDWRALRAALDDLALDARTREERLALVLRHGWDGDAALARRLVARDPSLVRDSVFTAAACGDVDTVRALVDATPSLVHATDPVRGWTPLAHVAYGRLDEEHALTIATFLLDAGADASFTFDDGWGNPFTLLTGAIGQGEGVKATHPQAGELAELLIARGADPYDTQALYNTSIVADDVAWLDVLWAHCERRGRTAAWSATDGPRLGGRFATTTLDYLLGNAVANDHRRRAAWLLAHGADANTRHAYSGEFVHTQARFAGYGAMATLLAEHGAREETLTGERALLVAVMSGDGAAVRAMLGDGPLPPRAAHLLHAAAARRNASAVEMLLALGADVGATDRDGATPLHHAVHGGSLPVVERLLAAGADPDRRDAKYDATAFGWAEHLGRPEIAERLAGVSRDVWALARSGRTERLAVVLEERPALARATRAGGDAPTPLFALPDDDERATEVAALLRRHGADTRVRNADGRTAADVARRRGLDETAERLGT